MLDTVENPVAGQPPLVQTPTKRELIVEELRTNPYRSDREIGRVCSVDHKTAAARRKRLGIASPRGNSPQPRHRPNGATCSLPELRISTNCTRVKGGGCQDIEDGDTPDVPSRATGP
jgi:hypothetical protein